MAKLKSDTSLYFTHVKDKKRSLQTLEIKGNQI